jgi:hypothetical protein
LGCSIPCTSEIVLGKDVSIFCSALNRGLQKKEMRNIVFWSYMWNQFILIFSFIIGGPASYYACKLEWSHEENITE